MSEFTVGLAVGVVLGFALHPWILYVLACIHQAVRTTQARRGSRMKMLVPILLIFVPALAWAEGWVLLAVVDGKWREFGSFDSARECERDRRERIELFNEVRRNPPRDTTWKAKGEEAYQQFLEAKCMPYDLWWQSQQSK